MPEALRTVSLRDAAPAELDAGDVLWKDEAGHGVIAPAQVLERHAAFTLRAPAGLEGPLSELGRICGEHRYTSAPVLAAQLHDVVVDLEFGTCLTADGRFVEESLGVARLIVQQLQARDLAQALHEKARNAQHLDRRLLHLFHRSAPAYGHFVLDGLVPLAWFLPAIQAGRLDVLLPPYLPGWVKAILLSLGVPQSAIYEAGGEAISARRVVIASSIDTSTTFLPDRGLCTRLASMVMSGLRPLGTGRKLYLSRARQTSYSQRSLSNESAAEAMLRARGFEILEPGNMPFLAQARAFAEADVIVGAHGSAFGNLVFARPGTAVIDLMPADWIGHWPSEPRAERWLLNLTTAMELDYHLILCRSRLVRVLPDDDQSGLQKFGMESEVDCDQLAAAIDALRPRADAAPSASREEQDDIGGLEILCDERLAPLFRLPDRRGTHSAWWGHVPFAGWLVAAARPRSIVELGSFSGVSYFAFCKAVLASGLDCRCHAVDTWQGDAHAGFYGDWIYEDFRRFNDTHYAGISTVHRCTFDEALERFPAGSVDLLHIDGLHTYEAVRHDFETWLPKLSERGIVLFHDANERMADFGVWRFWQEVAARWPGFLFPHSHGLGVLCVGPDAPSAVRKLCAADPWRAQTLRERMALIGERWHAQAQWDLAAAQVSDLQALLAQGQGEAAAPPIADPRLEIIRRSASWRITAPLRALSTALPNLSVLSRRAIRGLLGR